MVFDLVTGNLKSLFTIKTVTIDDRWDQINRVYMVMFCFIAACIMTLKQNLGTIIQCIADGKDADEKSLATEHEAFVNEYCSAHGLYTVREAYTLSWPDQIPYPGIVPVKGYSCFPGFRYLNGTPISCPDPADLKPLTIIYHVWYMFVPFYFCALGAAFYFPYTVFRHCSGIYDIKPLLISLMCNDETLTEPEMRRKVDNVSRWLYIKLDPLMNHSKPMTLYYHRHSMFFTVILVKIMYLSTSVLLMYVTHVILAQGSFLWYGYDFIASLLKGGNIDSMDLLFPKMVGCEIHMWAQSGLTQKSLLCVLPQNIGNQYFFLILWFLMVFVIVSNCASLISQTCMFVFISAAYKRFLATSLLKDLKRYRMVFRSVGTTGRCILQLSAEQSNPKIFEDLMEIVCSLLLDNHNKKFGKKAINTKQKLGGGWSAV